MNAHSGASAERKFSDAPAGPCSMGLVVNHELR